MRRIAAPLILITSIAAAAILWSLPINVSVLGTTGTCGPAAYAATAANDAYGSGELERGLGQLCRGEGLPLLAIGWIVLIAGIAATVVLWRAGRRRWPKAAVAFRAAVMELHQMDGQGLCVSCRVPWQCRTAQAVQVTLPPEMLAAQNAQLQVLRPPVVH